MIGDPLLHVQRPITPPGTRHRNEVHHVARMLVLIALSGAIGWVIVTWLTSGMPGCITDLPAGAQYHGWDNSWWTATGNLIGHSATEDATCIIPA